MRKNIGNKGSEILVHQHLSNNAEINYRIPK